MYASKVNMKLDEVLQEYMRKWDESYKPGDGVIEKVRKHMFTNGVQKLLSPIRNRSG